MHAKNVGHNFAATNRTGEKKAKKDNQLIDFDETSSTLTSCEAQMEV